MYGDTYYKPSDMNSDDCFGHTTMEDLRIRMKNQAHFSTENKIRFSALQFHKLEVSIMVGYQIC